MTKILFLVDCEPDCCLGGRTHVDARDRLSVLSGRFRIKATRQACARARLIAASTSIEQVLQRLEREPRVASFVPRRLLAIAFHPASQSPPGK